MTVFNSYPIMKKTIFLPLIIIFLLSIHPSVIFGQICPIPVVKLGNDTLLCPGESIYLDAGAYSSYLWNDGSTNRYLLVTQPGKYLVTVENYCGNTASDEIVIELAELPVFDFIFPEKEYYCKGELVNVTAKVLNDDPGVIYEWLETSNTDANIIVDTTGTYTLRVTNEYGCKFTRNVSLEFQYPFEQERILLATFDPSEDKNIVIWSRTPQKRTQSFLLFGGFTQNDLLAEADFQTVNLYVDQKADPAAGPSLYNIQVKDSCNNLSVLNADNVHRTMHLKAFTNADGLAQLEWTPYKGFPYEKFYIYQGMEPDKLNLIDSVNVSPVADIGTYIDRNAKVGVMYYYDVKVKTPQHIYLDNPDTKKAGSGPFVHSLSNLEDNLIRGVGMDELEIMDQYLRVFPNPIRDKMRISFRNESARDITFCLYDIAGAELARFSETGMPPGEFDLIWNPEEYRLGSGIYLLKMNIEGLGVLTRKIVRY